MRVLPLIGLLLLSNCVLAEGEAYLIHETQDGRVLRLNKNTGEMHLVEGTRLVSLSEKTATLQVGAYYEMGDAKSEEKFLKYLGNGKFERSKFAIVPVE